MLLLGKLLSRLPIALLQTLGAAIGWLVWIGSSRHRRTMQANLTQSGLAVSRNACIAHQGIVALEIFAHWLRPIPDLLPRVKMRSGWDCVEQALASQRPIIFISPHLGALEMTGVCLAGWVPRKLAPLYRPPKQVALEPLMVTSRSRGGAKPAPANAAGVRVLLKTLRQGGIAYLLPDQTPSAGEGIWAPFFGRPAYTMSLISKLAHSTNAIVLCCYTERLGISGTYHFHVEALDGAFSGETLQDATLLNHNLERLIQQQPTQYLWSYNRYKQPHGAPEPGEQP